MLSASARIVRAVSFGPFPLSQNGINAAEVDVGGSGLVEPPISSNHVN